MARQKERPIYRDLRRMLSRSILSSLTAVQLTLLIASGQDFKIEPYNFHESETVKRRIQPGQKHPYRVALTQG
jgi:hypothetical protein